MSYKSFNLMLQANESSVKMQNEPHLKSHLAYFAE